MRGSRLASGNLPRLWDKLVPRRILIGAKLSDFSARYFRSFDVPRKNRAGSIWSWLGIDVLCANAG